MLRSNHWLLGAVEVLLRAQWPVKRFSARRTGARRSYSTSSQFNAVGKPFYGPPEGPKPELPYRCCSSLKYVSIPALLRLATETLALAEHATKPQQPLAVSIIGFAGSGPDLLYHMNINAKLNLIGQ